ncbi:MAG: TRAP transporter small permease [Gammaproteobacteria bacterium]
MRTWAKRLHRAEDALLVLLLSAMIVLAGTQILLRNLLDSGFVWIDPLLRVLVLWLGLIGATVATRNNRHIRIDLLSKLFSRNTHRLIQSIIGQVSAWTCLVVAWYGFKWIQMDYADGVTSFAGIPAWLLEVIIPLTFALIGLRYLIMSVCWAQLYLRHIKVAQRAAR